VGNRPGPSAAGDGQLVRANLVGNSVGILDSKQSQTFNYLDAPRTGNFFFNPNNINRTGLSSTTTASVTNPSLRTYGTLPRNFFSGPSRTNFDLALAKMTYFREQMGLEFRAEFFNIFNHAVFNNPTTTITDKNFGQITTVPLDSQRIIQFALKFVY